MEKTEFVINGKGYRILWNPKFNESYVVDQYIPENKNKFGKHISGHYRRMKRGIKRDNILNYFRRLL